MVKKIIFSVIIGSAFAVSCNLSAGEMEDFSMRAGNLFFKPVTVGNIQVTVPASPALAAVNEYQNLAAAFKKGTVPAKEELTGWHAGRFFDRDFPNDAGSILLAGGEMQSDPVNGIPSEKAYKLVSLMLDASPTFYETMDPYLAEGVAISIKERQAEWTKPQFGPNGVTFERILPSYDKGFSRFEVRKGADNRILLKHLWKSDLGNYPSEGSVYAYVNKDVTPKSELLTWANRFSSTIVISAPF